MLGTMLSVNNDGTSEPGDQTRSRLKAGPLDAHFNRIGIAGGEGRIPSRHSSPGS